MIGSISSFTGPSQMAAMRGQMGNPFDKMDANSDGSLDEAELGLMSDKISELTGQSIDAAEILSKLDSDGDGLVNQDEFKAGRPDGPPPGMMRGIGMMGGGLQSDMMQSLLNIKTPSESEDDDESESENSYDTNGDGTVDADEAMAGITRLVQEYQDRYESILAKDDGSEEALSVQA